LIAASRLGFDEFLPDFHPVFTGKRAEREKSGFAVLLGWTRIFKMAGLLQG
jgi:hypothetical protein